MATMNILQEAEMFNNNEIKQGTSGKKFELWHENFKKKLALRAKMDGQKNIPSASDACFSIQEQQIKEEYKTELQKLIHPGLNILNGLNDEPLKNQKELVDDEVNERKKLTESHTQKINREIQLTNDFHTANIEKLRAQKLTAAQELKNIETQYNNKVLQHNREHLNNKVNPYFGWFFLISLGIVEAPLNAKVFEYFKLGDWETYLTAGIVILGFPLLSHFAGVTLHKGANGKANFKAAFALMLFIIMFCAVLNIFRVSFMDNIDHSGEKNYAELSIPQLILNIKFLFSFMLNVALFVIGISIAYFMHDTDLDFEKAYRACNFKGPKLKQTIQVIDDDISGASNTLQKELDKISGNLHSLETKVEEELKNRKREYNNYVALYDKVIGYLTHVETKVSSCYRQSILEYRKINELNRTTPNPAHWKLAPTGLDGLFTNLNLKEINPQS